MMPGRPHALVASGNLPDVAYMTAPTQPLLKGRYPIPNSM